MAKSSFNISTPGFIVLFALGYMGYQLLHKGSDSDDGETTKPKVVIKTADPDDDIRITKRMMSGSENDTLIVRTHDQQYVRIGDTIFCWRSNTLVGVFNKDGLVPGWKTMTNQPPPSNAP